MARDTPLTKADLATHSGTKRLFWSRRASLTTRILAVNIIALGLVAGSLFYLDNYRNQVLAERFNLARTEAEITAAALGNADAVQQQAMLTSIANAQHLRLRMFRADGTIGSDSFALGPPSFSLNDPNHEPFMRHAARGLDQAMDFILGAPPIADYQETQPDRAGGWPEIAEARAAHHTVVRQRRAPDRSPIITAATPIGTSGQVLLTLRYAPDITQNVRDARQSLANIVGAALLLSVLLSLFLARTIVKPLRILVRAAVRVRRGRDREVEVPRLPERGDEIGLLARAVSDMTAALRQRIDAVETFAADVAHEIKNPLASLRSALESLEKVGDPALRAQLTTLAAHDVQRIDRLITEIADASRIDAALSRTAFVAVDMLALAQRLVSARNLRRDPTLGAITLLHESDTALVAGDAAQLERVFVNLLDNAMSFSPGAGTICLTLSDIDDHIEISIEDHGPGIDPESREKVFERFHSLRPPSEEFGKHSGLGLAIARTIIAAHDGTLTAHGRRDNHSGARMVITIPRLSP